MKTRFGAVALMAALAAASCGDDDSTAPPAQTLVGTWSATSVLLVSVTDPGVRVDLVGDLGAVVTLTLAADDDFTLVLDYADDGPGGPWGSDATVTGTWSSTDVLTLRTSPTSEWQFEAALTGDTLVLSEADTGFDFGGDGTIEDADLGLTLTRA